MAVSSARGRKTVVSFVRLVMKAVCPLLYQKISYYRNEGRVTRVGEKLRARYGPSVQDGPFKGMVYLPSSFGSALAPKLLGCYEEELHPTVERLVQQSFSEIVDIGCAEGYYAVGLALRIPAITVLAFDISEAAQAMCRELSVLNGVSERVTVYGECTARGLNDVLHKESLVVSDCEGFEEEILDPCRVQALLTCTLLVETHDFLRSGVSEILEKRFEGTHEVEWITGHARDASKYPQLASFGADDRRAALMEHRPLGQKWCLLTPVT